MKQHVQRIGWREACNTHVFVNAVPQQDEMNQGDWLQLEGYSGAAANQYGRVWVVAGPIIEKGKPITWMTHASEHSIPVAVPGALFKLLIKENPGARYPDVLAFIFPQPDARYVKCSRAGRAGHTYNPAQYLVSVSEIEERTGLKFFRNVYFKKDGARSATQVRKDFVEQKPTAVWPVEEKYFALKCPW